MISISPPIPNDWKENWVISINSVSSLCLAIALLILALALLRSARPRRALPPPNLFAAARSSAL